MKKFLALMKVSARSMLSMSVRWGGKNRGRTFTGLGALALIALLGLCLSGSYSLVLFAVLAPVGLEGLAFSMLGLGALAGGVLFTVFAVKGVVFDGKDNDLLLALPVSDTVLMLSRVAAVWLENLVFSFAVLIPAGVACALLGESGAGRGPLFWVRLALAVLLLPLLDTALSLGAGALAAFVSSKVSRGRVLGQNLVMGVFLIVMFWLSFHMAEWLEGLAAYAGEVRAALNWAAPLLWMGDGILGDWGAMGLFALSCLVPFAAVTGVLGRVYRRAVTAFRAQTSRSDYRLTAQTASGQVGALLRKEARRFFGTPVYFWNGGLGLILMLIAAGASLLYRERLAEILGELGGAVPVLPLAAGVVMFCMATCVIAAPSISLEGKQLWILREAPVPEGRLLWCKTGFQLLLTLPCCALTCLGLSVGLAMGAAEGLALLCACLLYALGHACFSMLMGLVFPRLDAPNEAVVVKQSMAVLLSTLGGLALLVAAGLLWWLGSGAGEWLAGILPAAFLGGFAAVCAYLLVRRGPALLREL